MMKAVPKVAENESGRGPTEDIINYFTLMSSELHYLDIIPNLEKFTLMFSASGENHMS